MPETPNLVVLRTFSKWAGLAGLRLGYGIFPLEIMQHLWKFKQPYNVNVAATVAGLASLQDLPYQQERIAALKAERDRLIAELQQIPWLHPCPAKPTSCSAGWMAVRRSSLPANWPSRGILVRYYDKPGLRNCIRISAGQAGGHRWKQYYPLYRSSSR